MGVLATRYQVMLLVLWVLTIFYRTQFADISLVDDYGALNGMLNQDNFSLKELFFPRSVDGGYYRPLIGVSYWLDKELWFFGSRNLHLESILGHLLNTVLLFFCAQKASKLCQKSTDNYLPLFVALLFSVHPIVTESVNWISGRTDIMMSNFLLISLLCILQYKLNSSRLMLITGLLSAVIAMLAKETALGYIIGLPLLLLQEKTSTIKKSSINKFENSLKLIPFLMVYSLAVIVALYTGIYWLVLFLGFCYLCYLLYMEYCSEGSLENSVVPVRFIYLLLMFIGAVVAFVTIRKTVFTTSVGKIGQTVTLMLTDIDYSISVFLGAVGFYVKKFFLPLPLNFFILEISPLYDLFGIAIFFGVIYLLTLRKLSAVIILLGFLLMVPALPFAFGTIAWSGYAERYIYLSTAFWILAVGLACYDILDRYPRLIRHACLIFIMLRIIAGYITFNRNGVWQNNVTIMKDTVSKTPNMRKLHDIYIKSLLNAGMSAEAESQYRYALEVAPAGDNDASDYVMGGELIRQGRHNDALTLYRDAINRTRYTSERLLTAAIDLLRSMQNAPNVSCNVKQRLHDMEYDYVTKRSKLLHVKN